MEGKAIERKDMEGKDGWHGHGKESAGILNLDSDLGTEGHWHRARKGGWFGRHGYDRHDDIISTI